VDSEETGSIAPAAIAGVAALALLGAGGLVLARRRRVA
jgi:LPXTG-motif cell wall-anchored protein